MNTPQRSEEIITIGPRSEIIAKLRTSNPHNLKEGVVQAVTLDEEKTLLIPNAIVKVTNSNETIIIIVNRSAEKQSFVKSTIKIEPLSKKTTIFEVLEKKIKKKSNRIKLLQKNLYLSHLSEEERPAIIKLCEEFEDIFFLPNDNLTTTTVATYEIPTLDNIPIHVKSYRYHEVHKDEVSKQIEKMLSQGIIRPSTSPWSSPLWIVPKKDDASGTKKWRVVIHYRKLNEKTIGDAYSLPNPEDIFDQLGHAEYFTILDLASGFHQISMSLEDSLKTAFSTPDAVRLEPPR